MKTGRKASTLSSLCAIFSVLLSLPVEEQEDGWLQVTSIGMMKIEWQGDLGPGRRDGIDTPWNQSWIRKIGKKGSGLKDSGGWRV